MEPRYRILMVDDVTRYHSLYEMAITDALPAEVLFAVNGIEALEKLQSPLPFDLLILDLNMPKLGGEETLRRIRQDPSFDTMPVIILTGDTDQDTHRRLLDLGADDFVEKGAPPEVFVSRLKAQMRHKVALDRLTRVAVDMDIFAAGVLHDIRNLETNILTVAELTREYLGEDPIGHKDQIVADFASLSSRADSLGRYAAEVIQMVRETRRELVLTPQDPWPFVEWAMKMAAPQRGGKADVKLNWKINGPLASVIADRRFLQLAVLNVVQNAVKYRRPGEDAELVVGQQPGRPEFTRLHGPSVVMTFRDKGVGIKQGELRRVFEPFVRGEGRTKKESGFGLGLALVTKVMTAMKGRVWAELPPDGPGVVMCLELPVAEGAA